MDRRPLIAVTGDHRRWAPSWWCIALALRLGGARARRVSINQPAPDTRFDALIISGGNDVGPDLYGGAELPKAKIDKRRDEMEVAWIRHALDNELPILGICRGAQLLNVVLGGSLLQDLRAHRKNTSNRASLLPVKRVRLEPDSELAGCCKKQQLRVNSLHHQAIDKPGQDLRVIGRDRDSLCQAVEAQGTARILGVQWHPEYLFFLPTQRSVFRWLISRA